MTSEAVAQRMCELAREEAPARSSRNWPTVYALQDEQKRLGGVWVDLRESENILNSRTSKA